MSQIDLNRIVQLHQQGDLAGAEAGYRAAIDAGLRMAPIYLNLGLVYQATGRPSEALSCWETALQVEPNHVEAMSNIATLLVSMGEQAKAIGFCEKALAIDGKHFRTLNTLGNALLRNKHFDAAIANYRRAIELQPGYLTAQVNLAEALRETGQIDEAAAAYQQALALDPAHELARFGLAACQGTQQERPPESYVKNLFDDYAENFDEHLVGTLEYRTPSLMAEMIEEQYPGKIFDSALDLGCGTGLSGEAMLAISGHIDGVDLSEKMLAKAQEKEIYRELACTDVLTFLRACEDHYDLVAAFDVLVYVGELDAVFEHSARVCKDSGVFAFSVEAGETDNYTLRPTGRYSHSADYIQLLAGEYGFEVVATRATTLRKDRGALIDGCLYILEKLAATSD